MPTHLLHSGNEQAILFLGAIAVAVVIRFWRIVLTTFALMLIVVALIVFSVILDLHVVHEVAAYLRNLVHEITGLARRVPPTLSAGGTRLFLQTASWQRHGSAVRRPVPRPSEHQTDTRAHPFHQHRGGVMCNRVAADGQTFSPLCLADDLTLFTRQPDFSTLLNRPPL